MRKPTCAVAAVVLLGGCSNYVSPISSYEMKNADDLRVETYQDGERYVRVMKDKFQAKVQQLENEENFWKLGILGGGVTTLVGVIDKHPHTAIVGAGIAGGSYIYGQAFGPDVLRRIYLNGDAALNCVLLTGTKLNADLAILQYHIGRVQMAKSRLEKVLDATPGKVMDKSDAVKSRVNTFVQSERDKLRGIDIVMGSWNVPGGIIGRRMVVTTDIVRTKVNQLVKDNEATLASVYTAASKGSDIGIALKKSEYSSGTSANLFGRTLSETQGPEARKAEDKIVNDAEAEANEASKMLEAEVAQANTVVDDINKKKLANLDQFDACAVADVDGPLLVFNPTDLTLEPKSKLSLVITGGRPPYTWAPVGPATGDIDITTSSVASSSSVVQIESKKDEEKTYEFAFSSLHPKATPQIVKIKVQKKKQE